MLLNDASHQSVLIRIRSATIQSASRDSCFLVSWPIFALAWRPGVLPQKFGATGLDMRGSDKGKKNEVGDVVQLVRTLPCHRTRAQTQSAFRAQHTLATGNSLLHLHRLRHNSLFVCFRTPACHAGGCRFECSSLVAPPLTSDSPRRLHQVRKTAEAEGCAFSFQVY